MSNVDKKNTGSISKLDKIEKKEKKKKEIEGNKNILSNYKVNMNGNRIFKGTRKSCQQVLLFINGKDNNCLVKPSIERKKTTGEYNRSNNNNLIMKYDEKNAKFKHSKNKHNEDNNHNSKINISKFNRYIKIIRNNSSIYERSKKNLLRKKNIIKKKQAKQLEEIKNNLKGPFINEVSQNIIMKKVDYLPIEYRASSLHNKHIYESLLNEKRIELQKKKEEEKQYEIVKKYRNKKSFNEKEWENFINYQILWGREKKLKSKAAELIRDNIEQKYLYVPQINNKSKIIISNLRKKILYIDDIHTRLYKDYDNLQEKKKLRISNSMPSFKPLLNKSFNKNIFVDKSKSNRSINKKSKRLELLIEMKLNKNANPHNSKRYKNKSLTINNSKNKEIHPYYDLKHSFLKNSNIVTKKSNQNYSYLENKKNIFNNYKKYIEMNKTQNLMNNKNNNTTNKMKKSNSYFNFYNNK